MGFSWSLFFAQEINRDQVVQSGMTVDSELNAHSADSSFDKHALRFLVYVDNIAIFGRNAVLVNDMMRRVESRLNDVGLLTHELTLASTNTELLGLVVDGKRKEIRMSPKRFWRIRYAIEWVLSREKVSGKTIERIIGHITFASLLERCTLSVPHTIYKFIQKYYYTEGRLWKSVREELQALRGLLPTMRARLTRQWQTEVYAADACESGYGAVVSDFPLPIIQQHGRVSERSRFRLQKGGKSARAHAGRSSRK